MLETPRPERYPAPGLHQILAPHDMSFVCNLFAVNDFKSFWPCGGQLSVPLAGDDHGGALEAGSAVILEITGNQVTVRAVRATETR